jgi:hypothetical protein
MIKDHISRSWQSAHRFDKLFCSRVEKVPGHAVEGDILSCFVFYGQEQFIDLPINDVCITCSVLSNVEERNLRQSRDIRPKGLLSGNDAVTESTGSSTGTS